MQACIFPALPTHVLLTIGLVHLDGNIFKPCNICHEIYYSCPLGTGALSHRCWSQYSNGSRTDQSRCPRKASSFCSLLVVWCTEKNVGGGRAWEIVYKTSWAKALRCFTARRSWLCVSCHAEARYWLSAVVSASFFVSKKVCHMHSICVGGNQKFITHYKQKNFVSLVSLRGKAS